MKTKLAILTILTLVLFPISVFADDLRPESHFWDNTTIDCCESGSLSDFGIESETIIVMKTCYYEFEPVKDITAYEIALILPCISDYDMIDNLPEEAKRHFKEICY